jgi:hypothetical protein
MGDVKMPDPQWLSIALEEYKSLRTESLTAMGNQQTTLRFGTTVLGVTLGLAVKAEADIHARFWVFSLLVPILALVFFALYSTEFGRMVRVGRYIDAVETKINAMFPPNMKSPLGWEKWLDKLGPGSEKPRLPYYWGVPAIFIATTTFSTAMAYASRKGGPFLPPLNTLVVFSIWFIVVFMMLRIMNKLRTLRQHYEKFPVR